MNGSRTNKNQLKTIEAQKAARKLIQGTWFKIDFRKCYSKSGLIDLLMSR